MKIVEVLQGLLNLGLIPGLSSRCHCRSGTGVGHLFRAIMVMNYVLSTSKYEGGEEPVKIYQVTICPRCLEENKVHITS